jgi:hypothetical protein
VHGDLDEEIDGLHSRVRMLKGVRFGFCFALILRGVSYSLRDVIALLDYRVLGYPRFLN